MSSVTIQKISITDLATDCIVNAANEFLYPGGGVCGAIFSEAGYKELCEACEKIGGCPTGSAVITPGFRLKAKYIVHAAGPVWEGGTEHEPELLRSCYLKSMDLVKEYGCHSVGFPVISSGIYGYPKKAAWTVALQAVRDYFRDNPSYEIDVIFAVLDDCMLELGESVLKELE